MRALGVCLPALVKRARSFVAGMQASDYEYARNRDCPLLAWADQCVERTMALLVLKFGGTSVADLERIHIAAAHVKREIDAGNQCAVVVSAMAGQTDQLVELTKEAALLHDAREYDVVVSSGEQVTSGLLSIALQSIGVAARSWLGWQIPVCTDASHGVARIANIANAQLVAPSASKSPTTRID